MASICLRPRKRPMPWSTWTTRSPAARLVASVSASEAFFLRCGRSRRSPRMSCSERTTRSLVSKPLSSGSTTSAVAADEVVSASRQFSARRGLRRPWSVSTCAMRSREPSVQQAMTVRRPFLLSDLSSATTASNRLVPVDWRSAAKLWAMRPPASSVRVSSGSVNGESWIAGAGDQAVERAVDGVESVGRHGLVGRAAAAPASCRDGRIRAPRNSP